MASSGKKGKKIKGKTFGLTEFLADSATGPGAVQTVIPRKSANWADDVENEDDFYDFSRKEKVILPTAPRATRSPEIDDEKVPKEPPFLAYISNLSYDVDTDDIAEFFRDLEITGIRLPRDNSQKTKGFGYVEFTNRKSLISALSMGDTTMKNRRVRIEVADSSDNDRRRGGMRDRGEMGRDRTDGPDRTMGDWRSGPRSDPVPDSDRDTGGFGRDRDGGYDRRGGGRREFGSGGFRDGDRGFRDSYDRDRGYDNRDGFGGRYGSDRDRDGYGERDRDRFGSRRGGDRDRERDFGSGGSGSGNSSGGGRSGFGPPRRPYGSGPDYERGREDAPPERAEPRERPRLNLQPRTLPDEPAAAAPAAQSSIFGGAKPVDTSAREKEIEERLAKEKGDISRPPPRDNRSDDGRRDDHVRQISSQSHDRSKSGSDYGDRDDEGPSDKLSAPPRVEPAPPPKENAWTRRSQQTLDAEPAEDNGRLSPHSDHDQEQRSTGRYQPPRPESPRRYRGEAGDTERRQPSNRGTGRKQFDGDSRGGREERGSRDERMSRDDRGSKDERISRDDRGSRDERVNRDERAGRDEKGARRGGGASTRGDRQRRPPTERDHRKEAGPQDELGRMPKYREQEVPNFAGSNKFAYLDDDELAEAD